MIRTLFLTYSQEPVKLKPSKKDASEMTWRAGKQKRVGEKKEKKEAYAEIALSYMKTSGKWKVAEHTGETSHQPGKSV